MSSSRRTAPIAVAACLRRRLKDVRPVIIGLVCWGQTGTGRRAAIDSRRDRERAATELSWHDNGTSPYFSISALVVSLRTEVH